MDKAQLATLIHTLPKTELHLHIEGSLEPELMWQLAIKHNVCLPFESVKAIKQAYAFEDLQSFLDLYYEGANVLRDEADFFSLMWSYLYKCKTQNVMHCEIMFDPQTHTQRGISFATFMTGFQRAIDKAQSELGISVYLILSFLRHLSEADAIETLEQAKPYYSMISAVGLDSSELGNPPSKFERVFALAKSLGFKRVAHAGEEGPASYVWEAIHKLDVQRIDHGVKSGDDPALIAYLAEQQIPLTVCPLSNLKLGVVKALSEHNLLTLLNEGVLVTVNADDPSYFGGYLVENYMAILDHLPMNKSHIIQLIKNGFRASFLPVDEKKQWLARIDHLVDA